MKGQHISCLFDSVSRSCQQEFADHINHNYRCSELLPRKCFQWGNFASYFTDNAFWFRKKKYEKNLIDAIFHISVSESLSQFLHMSLREKKQESILENAINYTKNHFFKSSSCIVMGFYCNLC